MTDRISSHGLQIAASLHRFLEQEALPGTGVQPAAFWEGLAAIIHDLAPRNRALLAERDRLQAALDDWYARHPGPIADPAAYRAFLKDIGYLKDAPAQVAVTTFETLRNPDSQKSSIDVDVAPAAARVEVEVDRDVVVQALLNLLANAAKYGGAERPIEVTVGADATTGWISVRDHGPGIPPTEQARIFREFYRAPEAYRSGVEGTGLGLALVKRHIEALGGSVDVASSVGEGATFTIRLPRTEAA